MNSLTFRHARQEDLATLVAMLADDELGAQREDFRLPLPESYLESFSAIDRDANNELLVALHGDDIIGMLQLTFIPYLTYQGGWRCLVEGVRISKEHRGKGFGRQLFLWAIDRARERHCHLVQLTTDKQRPDALGFYQDLGFKASHEGMKLHL
ncbi:MAG: GNAT family N-acetyltransferase [Gammaproteobacteria bacterium]|nr:GNAT family N-acetyltransferase [Gammaproteobacteria bacterium]